MKLIEFIFQSFWHFIGAVILVLIIIDGIIEIVETIKRKGSN